MYTVEFYENGQNRNGRITLIERGGEFNENLGWL